MGKNIFLTSIGKKLVMSITGCFLILFLGLHGTINFFSVLDTFNGWGEADGWFQLGCNFMALPVIDVMVPILAAGFAIHILFALWLEWNNIKSRGALAGRYAVASKAKADSFAAKNMIYLGLILVLGIALHLLDFWQHMQLKEWMGAEAENPYVLLENTFGRWWVLLLYICWFTVLYLHLGHGFWSAFQTLGWNNMIWIKRLHVIGIIVAALIWLVFTTVAVNAFLHANGFFGLTSVLG